MNLPLKDIIPDVRTLSISSLEGMNQSVLPPKERDLAWESWYQIVEYPLESGVMYAPLSAAMTVSVFVFPVPIAVLVPRLLYT